MSVRIGISGWRYPRWRGKFYPHGLAQRRELEYASRCFPSIELNGSFYSLQTPQRYRDWYGATPPGFVFAVKGSRHITHLRRLRDSERALANFFASGLLTLRAKLGPILWQLPPSLKFDPALIDEFLGLLPRNADAALTLARRRDAGLMRGRSALSVDRNRRLRHAMEVRHDSFRDERFIALLRKHRVALVIADTARRWPDLRDVTADFVYIRLHGDQELYASGYGDPALRRWASRIRTWATGGAPPGRLVAEPAPKRVRRDVYCYFDNDAKVHAPFDAAALMEKLGVMGTCPPLEDFMS